MKVVKKTLAASVLACSTVHAQMEVSQFGYGIKAGGSVSSMHSYGEAKIKDKQVQSSFVDNLFVSAGLYGEYAITDYIGVGLEAGYINQGGSLTGEEIKKTEDGKEVTYTPSMEMTNHGIVVPLSVYVYPMGREVDEGILKVSIGASAFFPMGDPALKQDGKDMEIGKLSKDQKKEFPGLDIALQAGVGYEFPIGAFVEGKYNWGMMNRFTTEKDKAQTIFKEVKGLKSMQGHNVTLSVGYNLASLYCE